MAALVELLVGRVSIDRLFGLGRVACYGLSVIAALLSARTGLSESSDFC